jgi:hypothetical protein
MPQAGRYAIHVSIEQHRLTLSRQGGDEIARLIYPRGQSQDGQALFQVRPHLLLLS